MISRKSRLGLLRDHDFRQLFVADTISQIGTQVTTIALPLVAILTLHATPFEVGLLVTCEFIAFLLVGLPAGAWVDRMRRRNVLIAGDLGRAVALCSVPLAWWAGVLAMPQLYAVALVTGVLTVFFDVAYQSYLPHLVGRDHLVEGNAKLAAVQSVNQIGGPAAAGLLVQALTAPFSIAVDAISFLGSALFVRRIRKREELPPPSPDRHLGREVLEGLRFVLGNRLLRAIALTTSTSNLSGNIAFTMVMVLLAGELRLPAGAIGLLFSCGAVGGLAGALSARRIAQRFGQGPTIWLSLTVTSPFALVAPLAQRGWMMVVVAVGMAIGWWGNVIYNITQVSFRQGLTPERLLGRMNATMRFLVWGTIPIGSFVGGVLGQTLGVRPTLWIGFGGACLAFLPALLSPLRTMRELPVAPPSTVEQESVPVS